MIRAKFYGMSSGQEVARSLNVPVLTPEELKLQPPFDTATPLWLYILKESSLKEGGKQLGPVGARIVATTFVKVLQVDKDSILRDNRDFGGIETFEDFFINAGLATRPQS
jgi:hypothetical protein